MRVRQNYRHTLIIIYICNVCLTHLQVYLFNPFRISYGNLLDLQATLFYYLIDKSVTVHCQTLSIVCKGQLHGC